MMALESSCLYVDGLAPVNERPEARLELLAAPPIYVGDEVVLSAEESRDPDGKIVRYDWSLEWDVNGQEETGFTDCLGQPSCKKGGEASCCFVPLTKATFTVTVRVFDSGGLESELAKRTVVVSDRAPHAVISLETQPKDTGHFVVGESIWFHGLASWDPDENDRLSYLWEATLRPPGSQVSDFLFQPSTSDGQPTEDLQEAVSCLMVPDYPGSYEVTLTVSDGSKDDSVTKHIEVDEDGPPCLSATNPDARAGPLVVPAGSPTRLEVLEVRDDLDTYPPGNQLRFSWSIQYDDAGPFVPVRGYDAPFLDLQAPDVVPGTRLQVRVTIQDRVPRDLAACDPAARTCELVVGCAQWVTWTIEYR